MALLFDVAHDCVHPLKVSQPHLFQYLTWAAGAFVFCLSNIYIFLQTVCADAAHLEADTAFTAAANNVILF